MENNMFGEEVLSVGGASPFSALVETVEPIELGTTAKTAEDKPLENPKEVKTEETPITGEAVKKEVIDDVEGKSPKATTKSKNPAFIIADSFKKEGIFPEDAEFSEEMTSKDLKALLLDSTKKEAEDILRSEYEQKYSPETLKTADMVNKGIAPEDLQEVNYYKRLANVSLGDDEDKNIKIKEAMIRRMYEDKGISDKKIDKMVEDSIEEDEGDSDFEDAKKYFASEAKDLDSKIQANIAESEKAADIKQDALNKEIKSLIKSGDIYNTTDEKAKKALESFLFDQNEIVKVEGKQFRVTGFQKKLNEYQNDLKQQMTFAKLLMNGFDLTSIEDSGKNKAAEELDNLLGATIESNGKQNKDEETTKISFDFSKMEELMS